MRLRQWGLYRKMKLRYRWERGWLKNTSVFTLEMTENENVAHFVLLRNRFLYFVAAGL